MKVLLAVFLCLWVLGLTHGRSAGPLRVANGTAEEPYSSPWQAKLYFAISFSDYLWTCGGVLISRNYVLTAAECFTYAYGSEKKANNVFAYLGIYDLQEAPFESGSLFLIGNVSEVTYHEGYDATTHEHDIALIKLSRSIALNSQIQPAKLLSTESVEVDQVGHISGWSYPTSELDPDNIRLYLHGGSVTVVDNSVCQQEYPSYVINENGLCTSGTVALCYGDEGSALTINGTVAGIALGSKVPVVGECPIVPNTYLYIPKYLDWIKANSDYTD